jgi:hypothetical protein
MDIKNAAANRLYFGLERLILKENFSSYISIKTETATTTESSTLNRYRFIADKSQTFVILITTVEAVNVATTSATKIKEALNFLFLFRSRFSPA